MRSGFPVTPPCHFLRADRKKGFSLVELLVSTTIFVSIMAVLFSSLDMSQKSWKRAHAQLSQYREAQIAFETMSRRISDAVLNTYWDYDYPEGDTSQIPTSFDRQSELHFVSGPAAAEANGILGSAYPPSHAVFFLAPFGLHNKTSWRDFSVLLNGWGYYIEFGNVSSTGRPPFLGASTAPDRYRFRLMELQVPAEELTAYEDDLRTLNSAGDIYAWFQDQIDAGYGRPLAENIIALIIAPEAPEAALRRASDIAPQYFYDTRAFQHIGNGSYPEQRSKHQLPPLLRISLVGIDETSALRLQSQNGTNPPDFGLDELFLNQVTFKNDLETLETTLKNQNINYRVFSTVIRLRNARWSDTN